MFTIVLALYEQVKKHYQERLQRKMNKTEQSKEKL